jgi:hypothetical protein
MPLFNLTGASANKRLATSYRSKKQDLPGDSIKDLNESLIFLKRSAGKQFLHLPCFVPVYGLFAAS